MQNKYYPEPPDEDLVNPYVEYSDENICFKYRSKLAIISDAMAIRPNGILFPLDLNMELFAEYGFEVMLKIEFSDGQTMPFCAEGYYRPATRGLTGVYIAKRLYIFIHAEQAIMPLCHYGKLA